MSQQAHAPVGRKNGVAATATATATAAIATTTTIWIVAGYLLCQIIADVTAVKVVSLWGLTFPAATFIYALTFTMRDLAHKQMGKSATKTLIWAAACVNVLMALYFVFTIWLEPAPFWTGQEAYAATLGLVPRIVGASIIAELIAELVDTEIYQLVWSRHPQAPQFLRVLGSNLVASPLDSLIFVFIAFAGTMPIAALWSLVLGQTLFKLMLTVVSMPAIYLIPENPALDPRTGDPVAD